MASDFLMARQPILDREGRVHAYELLYRRANGPLGEMSLEDEHRSLLNAMVEVGLGRLVGDKPAFFNLSPEMLASACTNLLPPRRVVLELLENTVLDDSTQKRLTELKRAGYRFAYDDFTFQSHQMPFVGCVDLIKIDVMATCWPLVEQAVPRLKATGTRVLAEKVEDRETHERCLQAGFDLFQGYYFSRPETLCSQGVDTRQRTVLRLLNTLNRSDVTAAQLEVAIASDASLAARLMKLVNSVGFGGGRKIDSIRVAIQMLGMERLQAFATLLAAGGASRSDNRTLSDLGLIRARMCERVSRQLGRDDPHKHFTIGLFSILDALMNLPMDGIVAELSLSDDVADALLDPSRSQELTVVTAYERGGWAALGDYTLDAADLHQAYEQAIADTAALD